MVSFRNTCLGVAPACAAGRAGRRRQAACRERGEKPLCPTTPLSKLNGQVEQAHRTHAEGFYEMVGFPLEVSALNQALGPWEQTYNTLRPHHALDWRTPAEYSKECHPELAPPGCMSHM